MPNPVTSRPGRSRFTLIELLVVVAIIAILAALLLPALGRARRSAHFVVCASNQRSVAQANMLYSIENADELPPSIADWQGPCTSGVPSTITNAAFMNYHADDNATQRACRNGARVYLYMGDYLPDVRPFYCPLGGEYNPVWQSEYEGYTKYLMSSYSLLWNYDEVGASRATDDGDSLLTADFIYQWTANGLSASNHPVPGGARATHPALAGYSPLWQFPGAIAAIPPTTLYNASYLDGHVERFRVRDTRAFDILGTGAVYNFFPDWQ